MKISIIMFLFSIPGSVLWSQKESSEYYQLTLGDSTVKIHQHFNAPESEILFINIHEDEQTSIEALHIYSEEVKINFLFLEHNGSRRVAFNVRYKQYSIDPNRIYTSKGRKATLKDGDNFSIRASRRTRLLSKKILNFIEEGMTVIAMHNNTDVNYSIKSYLPGEDESENTKDVFISEKMDPDDFIYTTEQVFFDQLKALEVNVILQDNEACVNDGSLSVYCGKNNIPYINIEAQKGHLDEQLALIRVVMSILTNS